MSSSMNKSQLFTEKSTSNHDKVKDLNSYLEKLKNLQAESSKRNKEFLSDFDRVSREAELLTNKTEKLKNVRNDYQDYIGRVFPQWKHSLTTEKVQKSPRHISENVDDFDVRAKLSPRLSPRRNISLTDTNYEEMVASKYPEFIQKKMNDWKHDSSFSIPDDQPEQQSSRRLSFEPRRTQSLNNSRQNTSWDRLQVLEERQIQNQLHMEEITKYLVKQRHLENMLHQKDAEIQRLQAERQNYLGDVNNYVPTHYPPGATDTSTPYGSPTKQVNGNILPVVDELLKKSPRSPLQQQNLSAIPQMVPGESIQILPQLIGMTNEGQLVLVPMKTSPTNSAHNSYNSSPEKQHSTQQYVNTASFYDHALSAARRSPVGESIETNFVTGQGGRKGIAKEKHSKNADKAESPRHQSSKSSLSHSIPILIEKTSLPPHRHSAGKDSVSPTVQSSHKSSLASSENIKNVTGIGSPKKNVASNVNANPEEKLTEHLQLNQLSTPENGQDANGHIVTPDIPKAIKSKESLNNVKTPDSQSGSNKTNMIILDEISEDISSEKSSSLENKSHENLSESIEDLLTNQLQNNSTDSALNVKDLVVDKDSDLRKPQVNQDKNKIDDHVSVPTEHSHNNQLKNDELSNSLFSGFSDDHSDFDLPSQAVDTDLPLVIDELDPSINTIVRSTGENTSNNHHELADISNKVQLVKPPDLIPQLYENKLIEAKKATETNNFDQPLLRNDSPHASINTTRNETPGLISLNDLDAVIQDDSFYDHVLFYLLDKIMERVNDDQSEEVLVLNLDFDEELVSTLISAAQKETDMSEFNASEICMAFRVCLEGTMNKEIYPFIVGDLDPNNDFEGHLRDCIAPRYLDIWDKVFEFLSTIMDVFEFNPSQVAVIYAYALTPKESDLTDKLRSSLTNILSANIGSDEGNNDEMKDQHDDLKDEDKEAYSNKSPEIVDDSKTFSFTEELSGISEKHGQFGSDPITEEEQPVKAADSLSRTLSIEKDVQSFSMDKGSHSPTKDNDVLNSLDHSVSEADNVDVNSPVPSPRKDKDVFSDFEKSIGEVSINSPVLSPTRKETNSAFDIDNSISEISSKNQIGLQANQENDLSLDLGSLSDNGDEDSSTMSFNSDGLPVPKAGKSAEVNNNNNSNNSNKSNAADVSYPTDFDVSDGLGLSKNSSAYAKMREESLMSPVTDDGFDDDDDGDDLDNLILTESLTKKKFNDLPFKNEASKKTPSNIALSKTAVSETSIRSASPSKSEKLNSASTEDLLSPRQSISLGSPSSTNLKLKKPGFWDNSESDSELTERLDEKPMANNDDDDFDFDFYD